MVSLASSLISDEEALWRV